MKRKRVISSTAGKALEASPDITNASDAKIASNLPKIPGVPYGHIPIFMEAIRKTSKFFKERASQHFTISDWERINVESTGDHCNGNPGNETVAKMNNESLHDSIMDRMDAISYKSESNSTGSSNVDGCQRKFVMAVIAWVDDVKHLTRQGKRQQCTTETSFIPPVSMLSERQQSIEKQNSMQSVAYSIFLYLWEMQQQHKRVTVRRSALFLSGLLLLRSKDCRFHLDQESHLAEWVSNIGVKIDNINYQNSDSKIIQLVLLQKEAISLINMIVDRGFGKMYSKLAVAAKSLRHRCATSLVESSDLPLSMMTSPDMANWRRLRDFSLLHGRKEIQKVRKLLDKADECLEILVPRMGGIKLPTFSSSAGANRDEGYLEEVNSSNNQDSNHNHGNENIDDGEDYSDDGDIDWEDGDEIEEYDAKTKKDEKNLHLSAVERTMVAMEKTGEGILFSGGRLEIDFDRQAKEECGDNEAGNINDDHALEINKVRRRLETIVRKLSIKHLVRLSAWLDGLRNSDNLVKTESSSLVSLSQENSDLRLELIDQLSALRQDVSRIISSAMRLNIKAHKGTNEVHTNPNRNIANLRNGNVVSLRGRVQAVPQFSNQSLPKKTNTHDRFRKIKIKFKK